MKPTALIQLFEWDSLTALNSLFFSMTDGYEPIGRSATQQLKRGAHHSCQAPLQGPESREGFANR